MRDSDLMPFGKYFGKKMIDIPAPYLMFLLNNNCGHQAVKAYIDGNLEILKAEVKKIKLCRR